MKRLFLIIIAIYKTAISPFLPQSCRFHPTCSDYCSDALKEHGFVRGMWLFIKRLLKCHPFHPGGYDPVQQAAPFKK
ncbi:MAG: hypothetical protein AMK71_04545 [Nitrospira bacterium SG8_35_4]|nr:MAG: hypothetical protein AMK71_04545 [Nitrospira bacterium SG8_35_4]